MLPTKECRTVFVRAKKKSESRWQVQVVSTDRSSGKPRQKIVKNIGSANSSEEKEALLELGRKAIIDIENDRNPVLPFADPEDFHTPKSRKPATNISLKTTKEEARINRGFEMVMKPLFNDMDIDVGKGEVNETIGYLAMTRAFQPTSKLKAKQIISEQFQKEIDLHKIYRCLDHLADNEESIKKCIGRKTIDLFEDKVDVMFFDVTTLSFESKDSDDLRNFGFSKDCKFNDVQVVLALVTTTEGMPITYKLFPGNKFEGHTLIPVIEELKRDFNIDNIILAADRGMFSKDNLAALHNLNIKYVVGAKLKTLSKAKKESILSDEDVIPCVVGKELLWTKEIEHNASDSHKRKLIVSYSSKRAKKDASDRNKLVDRLLKKAKDGKIGLDKLISNAGTKKYINSNGKNQVSINYQKIEADSAWDGIHGLITNSDLSPQQVIDRYRGLWQIEDAFRVNKHDLKMRPIYHWNPKRIQGHICLCFITYSLVKQVQFMLAKAGLKISVKRFLEELQKIQASILLHQPTGRKYLMPSALSETAKNIFDAFGIIPKTSVQPID